MVAAGPLNIVTIPLLRPQIREGATIVPAPMAVFAPGMERQS